MPDDSRQVPDDCEARLRALQRQQREQDQPHQHDGRRDGSRQVPAGAECRQVAASIDFMIGEWAGGEFDTGHRANGFMKRLNWFGKTFVSATDAKPPEGLPE